MSIVTFPSDPVNGMLFEAVPGLFYRYNAGMKCWIRIEGLDSLQLATPLTNGLMSKEDFRKLQDLIIPPIRSTLTGEDCGDTVFNSGVVALQSDDSSLEITNSPKVINKVNGQIVGGPQPWELHENTAGYDFTVPIDDLVQRIDDLGLLSRVQIQGVQGPRGEPGEPGVDRLDTGPVGPQGTTGANSPFGGALTTESVPLERINQENRAIVDISVEDTADGSFLIVTRANVGNPDACPALVIPKDLQSSLMVVLNELEPKLVRNENVLSGDCSLICRICASTLHHIDIDPVLDEVSNHFRLRLQRLKLAKEALVRYWLQAMVSLFNEQKSSLCCALENCRSRMRNERTRQYIETQRIQAANGGFRLNISSDEEDKVKVDMDNFKNCPVPVAPNTGIEAIPGGVQFCLDSRVHVVDPRTGNTAQSLKAFLPAGDYIVTITDCCANFNQSVAGNQFSGRTALLYQSQDGSNGPIATTPVTFPNFGNYNSEQEARSTYNGLTLSFSHAGGDVSAWLIDPDGYVENNAGKVTITIVDNATLEEATNPSDPGIVYVYRNEVALDTLIGSVTPYSAGIDAEANLGLDTDENINLVSGPFLSDTLVSTFFYNGTDGFSVFFVAGNNPQFNTQGNNENDTEAVIQVRILITNNTVPADVRVAKGNVTKVSNSEFVATLPINGDAAGFALGEIDAGSDYSITVIPTDLSLMTVWRAQGPSASLLLAESDESGIGTGSTSVRQGGTLGLYDISSVPDEFGGPEGLEVENELGGQDIYIDRPIGITVVNERPLDVDDPRDIPVDDDEPRDVPVPEIPIAPEDDPGITIVPEETPPSTPPQPQKPSSLSVCEIDTSLIPTSTPTGVMMSSGTLVPPVTTASGPVPSDTIIAQDPCIVDVIATVRPTGFTSLRYVFTDDLGIKYYSAFVTVPSNQALLNAWSEISLGPPVKSIAPPAEFTTAVLENQNLDLSTVAAQLTTPQRQKAESLTGVARLTYVQELLGSPISSLADTNNMVRFEIQVERMTLNQAVAFGEIVAVVGTIGNTLEYTIDNFVITQDGTPSLGDQSAIGRTKRTVATRTGTGVAYHDLVHYWGDYTGFDTAWKRGIDFNGNQFFILNKVDGTRITHVKYNESNNIKFFGDIRTRDNQPFAATSSGVINTNALAVDYYGVAYTVDAQSGEIAAYFASNAQILNTTFGDVNGGAANSAANGWAVGFPTSQNLPAKITIGRLKMSGPNIVHELIVNFNGTWWAVDGAAAVLLINSPAARIDGDTARCCQNPGPARCVALSSFTGNRRVIGNSPAGNSIATDRPLRPQPSLPVPSFQINQGNVDAINAEFERDFNQFNLYCLDDDGKIYLVDQSNGSRTLFRDLGEPAFGLKCNPRTKDLYFIPADRQGFGNDYPSGTRIKRVDIDDIDMDTGLPRIKTVWIRDNETEGVFAIEFANTVPADPTRSQNALYALISTAIEPNPVLSNTTKVIEIAELPTQLPPGPDLTRQPTNGVWSGSGTGGTNPGGPGSSGNPIVFSRTPPGAGCQMFHRQVEWYERGWRIGACCGALVELNGTYWIVVKRSIGIDLSCGGGESENTPCIRQYLDSGEGHPAIAWPTSPPPIDPPEPGNGGEEFLGRPTSGFVNFVKDETLSDQLLALIRSGASDKTIGSPGTEIPFILFPSI